MDRIFNPEMLKLIRQVKGLNQKDFCEKAQITQGTLSKLEQGLYPPNEDLINDLAINLHVPSDFFYQKGEMYPPSTPLHRSKSTLRKRYKDRVEALANIYRIHMNKLLDAVEIDFKIPQINKTTPKMAAILTRQNLRMPYGAVKNMTELLEKNGVFVFFLDFESEEIDGFTIFGDGIHPLIFINNSFPGDRVRFTLAHELGHIVMHYIKDGEESLEQEANEFASEFLMPENEIKKSLTYINLQKLINLKRQWKVSMNALLKRATDLKTLTYSQSRYLWMQMASKGYRKQEPVLIPVEKSTLIKELIDLHFKELEYTKQEICKLLCLYEDDFDKYYNFGNIRLKIVRE